MNGLTSVLARGCVGVGLAVLSLVPLNAAASDPRPPYRFFLDGELLDTDEVSLGPSEDLDIGGLILVDGIVTPVGPGREFRFVRAPNGLQLENPDGSRRWVAVRVVKEEPGSSTSRDGLAPLSRPEVAGLWSLSIYDWLPSCDEKIGWIDAARTRVDISGGDETQAVPALPEGIRYLELSNIENWSGLRNLRELRELTIRYSKSFDAGPLRGMTELRRLSISSGRIINARTLSALKRLEQLSLQYVSNLDSIRFVASLPGLEQIDIAQSGRRNGISLRPLSRLQYIRSIRAYQSGATDLPEGPLPWLRYIDVYGTNVKRSDIAAFRSRRPDVEFYEGATKATEKVITGATRARLYSLSFEGKKEGFADVEDPAEIAELLGLFQIDETRDGMCGCLASRLLQLFKGDTLLDQFTIACTGASASGVRSGGWLLPKQAKAMDSWLTRVEARILDPQH